MGDGTIVIAKAETDGVEVITLRGEVDLTNADLVREAVDGTTSERVVLDLSAVTFLDSMAIGTLNERQRQLAAEDRLLVVVSPPTTPSAWTLRVAGLDRGVVRESLDDALAAIVRHSAA
jgi:anti-anti-sigma factor